MVRRRKPISRRKVKPKLSFWERTFGDGKPTKGRKPDYVVHTYFRLINLVKELEMREEKNVLILFEERK